MHDIGEEHRDLLVLSRPGDLGDSQHRTPRRPWPLGGVRTPHESHANPVAVSPPPPSPLGSTSVSFHRSSAMFATSRSVRSCSSATFVFPRQQAPKLGPRPGLHFLDVLQTRDGDEMGFARRLIARRAKAPRDIVFVATWFTQSLRGFPELPSLRGWVEAMAPSLGRLIFLDQPGTGISP